MKQVPVQSLKNETEKQKTHKLYWRRRSPVSSPTLLALVREERDITKSLPPRRCIISSWSCPGLTLTPLTCEITNISLTSLLSKSNDVRLRLSGSRGQTISYIYVIYIHC